MTDRLDFDEQFYPDTFVLGGGDGRCFAFREDDTEEKQDAEIGRSVADEAGYHMAAQEPYEDEDGWHDAEGGLHLANGGFLFQSPAEQLLGMRPTAGWDEVTRHPDVEIKPGDRYQLYTGGDRFLTVVEVDPFTGSPDDTVTVEDSAQGVVVNARGYLEDRIKEGIWVKVSRRSTAEDQDPSPPLATPDWWNPQPGTERPPWYEDNETIPTEGSAWEDMEPKVESSRRTAFDVSIDDGDWIGPWEDFVATNLDDEFGGGIDSEEMDEIKATIERGETYHGGGGAGAEWTIRKAGRLRGAAAPMLVPSAGGSAAADPLTSRRYLRRDRSA